MISVTPTKAISRHKGEYVTSFPDVCKVPGPAGPVPVPYPNITAQKQTTGVKQTTGNAPGNFKNAQSAAEIQGRLNALHLRLLALNNHDPGVWHSAVDAYVGTVAELFRARTST